MNRVEYRLQFALKQRNPKKYCNRYFLSRRTERDQKYLTMEKKIGSIDSTSFVKIRKKLNEKSLQTIQGNDVEMVAICEL